MSSSETVYKLCNEFIDLLLVMMHSVSKAYFPDQYLGLLPEWLGISLEFDWIVADGLIRVAQMSGLTPSSENLQSKLMTWVQYTHSHVEVVHYIEMEHATTEVAAGDANTRMQICEYQNQRYHRQSVSSGWVLKEDMRHQ